jgi:hypothetical protein
MTYGFARTGGTYLIRLSAEEAQAVGLAVAQLAGVVQSGHRRPAESAASRPDPADDAVVARLFPDGYRDDPEAAAELRSLTESSLREQKIVHAAAVLDDLPLEGGEVRLDSERAEAWLLALNDARLMLGTALDITADTDPMAELDAVAGADPTGTRALGLSLYQFLTALQDSLIEAVDPEA